MIQNDEKACVTWCEDNAISSIEDVEILQLETAIAEEPDNENESYLKRKRSLTFGWSHQVVFLIKMMGLSFTM